MPACAISACIRQLHATAAGLESRYHGIHRRYRGHSRSAGDTTLPRVAIGDRRPYDHRRLRRRCWRATTHGDIVAYDFDKSPQPSAAYLRAIATATSRGLAYRQCRRAPIGRSDGEPNLRPRSSALRELLALSGPRHHGGSMRTPLPEWELQAVGGHGQRGQTTSPCRGWSAWSTRLRRSGQRVTTLTLRKRSSMEWTDEFRAKTPVTSAHRAQTHGVARAGAEGCLRSTSASRGGGPRATVLGPPNVAAFGGRTPLVDFLCTNAANPAVHDGPIACCCRPRAAFAPGREAIKALEWMVRAFDPPVDGYHDRHNSSSSTLRDLGSCSSSIAMCPWPAVMLSATAAHPRRRSSPRQTAVSLAAVVSARDQGHHE